NVITVLPLSPVTSSPPKPYYRPAYYTLSSNGDEISPPAGGDGAATKAVRPRFRPTPTRVALCSARRPPLPPQRAFARPPLPLARCRGPNRELIERGERGAYRRLL